MRTRLVAATVAALSLLVFPTAALANHGPDTAKGNFRLGPFGDEVQFSARSSNTGFVASGHVRITSTSEDPNVVWRGEVTCLKVIGATETTPATAIMTGPIVDQPAGSSASSFYLEVTDSGKFAQSPDTGFLLLTTAPPPPPDTCVNLAFGLIPISQGEVVIHNTLP